jgi:predicted transcriptional regulator
MAIHKKEAFTHKEQELAEFAKALAHPARISILKVLAQKNECICGEIVEILPLAQSTVSQHLKELKAAGIIKGEISGVKTCYCIDENNWTKMGVLFNKIFDAYTNTKKCC